MPDHLTLDLRAEDLALKRPFHITGHVFTSVPAIVVRLSDGAHSGIGEASGVYYLGDDIDHMVKTIESVRGEIESGLSREALQQLLPPGGARNALDCAYWDLEARRRGQPVWKLAGLGQSRPLLTTMTAGAEDPETMVRNCREYDSPKALKLKLTGEVELDGKRVDAVRAAFPDIWIGVDANQGYTIEGLRAAVEGFVRNDVKLIEQPLRRGDEASLDGFSSPIPIAADESVLSSADLEGLVGRFDVINIKLDKCGGLTEGLKMAKMARELGFRVMVGCMAGSSWAMAAAHVVGQYCDVVDLDGPLTLKADRVPGMAYEDGLIRYDANVWGGGIDRTMEAA
ncbi:dipeptide epimerase [Sphingosinicella rhizophila]|uniref:Dipeptide epimerase n=1 Tax=Sphingosinicella rhizophila TaxID=3050082 RepID=A0ABU3Q471_9SPHN|nr:dipeptide epimerase [Sphingosinicella sp. GR2756]MDT9598199.1 dipeptide epimerase [Sphingosinicella sp. GR2756]